MIEAPAHGEGPRARTVPRLIHRRRGEGQCFGSQLRTGESSSPQTAAWKPISLLDLSQWLLEVLALGDDLRQELFRHGRRAWPQRR